MKKKTQIQNKKPVGRPEIRTIPRIDTTPEELAKAMFRNAERQRKASSKIKFEK
ncbi:MAG: hypothetical protein OXC97_06660 [Candidatus Dadabacteria bacterium]|nr:hypothetical protein [Candidatus Dadabacteria bacterium]